MLTRCAFLVALPFISACGVLDSDDGLISGGSTCGSSNAAPEIGAWSTEAALFEDRVLELGNQRRAQGGCCGSLGCFDATPALVPNENLRVSARLHARDMGLRNFFAHENPDGDTMLDRTRAAGFAGCAVGENIAQGQRSPEEVLESWMTSEGHCKNILSNKFMSLGVGHYDEPDATLPRVWVQNFGG